MGIWPMVILIALAFGSGSIFGINWESDHRDAKELRAQAALVAEQKIIVKHDTVVKTIYIERKVARETEHEAVNAQVAQHGVTLPDPPACWIADERVRAIDRAWGLPADQPGRPPGVSGPEPPHLRLSPGAGKVGSGTGLQVPGLRGFQAQAQRAGEEQASGRGQEEIMYGHPQTEGFMIYRPVRCTTCNQPVDANGCQSCDDQPVLLPETQAALEHARDAARAAGDES